jgi:hypothetical protein
MFKNIFSCLIYLIAFVLIMTLFKRMDLFGFSKRSTLRIILEGVISGSLFFVIISYYVNKKEKKSKGDINPYWWSWEAMVKKAELEKKTTIRSRSSLNSGRYCRQKEAIWLFSCQAMPSKWCVKKINIFCTAKCTAGGKIVV